MSFDKIFVLGAGAIGSSYGALLSRKNDVTLIGNENHVDAIISRGLTLSGDVQKEFFIKAETKIREVTSNTLILLTTKAHDSEKAITEIKGLLKDDTVILILQNGLGNKELVKRIVRDEIQIVRGLVKSAAQFLEPGKIAFWNGETILEQTKMSKRIVWLFNESGLRTRISNEMDEEMWNKLVVNCVVNPITAILRVRDNEVAVDSLRQLRHGIVEECVKVGKCEGIVFQLDLKEAIEKDIMKFTNFSSMCQDIMKRKKTEIDFLNGKIVELGKKHNIPTPINEAMTCLIKFLEENK
jgi:2-dehydropantoate 2-reductase